MADFLRKLRASLFEPILDFTKPFSSESGWGQPKLYFLCLYWSDNNDTKLHLLAVEHKASIMPQAVIID